MANRRNYRARATELDSALTVPATLTFTDPAETTPAKKLMQLGEVVRRTRRVRRQRMALLGALNPGPRPSCDR